MIFVELFLNFLKIGLFTIGGGYAMIPLISEVCISHGWLTSEQLIDFIAIAESTPGPFAINVATFVGNIVGSAQLGSFWGAALGCFCAVGGLFVPSFVIILIVYKLSARLIKNKVVTDAFSTVRPTVVALIASAFVSVAVAAFFIPAADGTKAFSWFSLVWFVVCFAALRLVKKMHPILLIILSAGAGILFYGVIM